MYLSSTNRRKAAEMGCSSGFSSARCGCWSPSASPEAWTAVEVVVAVAWVRWWALRRACRRRMGAILSLQSSKDVNKEQTEQ